MAQKHNEEQINAPMTRLGTMALSGQQRIIRSSAFAAAKFTADNPVLQLGEMGYETDTGLLKVGDGVTAWNDLPYIGGGAGGLPSQTGHSGEFLTTDGTNASWADIKKVNTTITLAVANWSDDSQTVSVIGITADGVVLVSPIPSDQSAYTTAGIICSAQAAGTLTFTCSTTPSAAIDVNVVML